MRRAGITLAAIALVGAVAGAGVATSADATPAAQARTFTVNVSITEYAFTVPRKTFPVGSTVVFRVRNRGDQTHNFAIHRAKKATRILGSGRTATLRVTFTRRGPYQYICTVGQHAVEGMYGMIRIT
jgi:plastocyanin